MPERDDRKEPIKVTDRRAFTRQGERRAPQEQDPASRTAEPEAPAAGSVQGEGFELRRSEPPAQGPPAEVEFHSFILSLATTAFLHLGEMPDPVSQRIEVNLEGARQMIDVLDMLRLKTRGNLDAAESELLEGVLYELKMKYAVKAPGPGAGPGIG